VDDPDAIWRPDYAGPPPVSSSPADVDHERSGDAPEQADEQQSEEQRTGRAGRWRIAAGALAVVVVAVVAVLVVLDPFTARAPTGETQDTQDTEETAIVVGPPDRSVFAGPEDRRLPQAATELWTVEFDGVGDHWAEVIGRELVVVAIERLAGAERPEPDTALVAFDAVTGEQRWTLPLAAGPSDIAVVGSVDDLLVLEQPGASGSIVAGIDMVAGEVRWFTDAQPNAGHVGLAGTRFVARLPVAPASAVTLLDATTGRELAELDSDPGARGRPGGWITDRRGTWYSVVDGEARLVIPNGELGTSASLGPVAVDAVTPIVVGDRLVVADGDGVVTVVGPDGRRTVIGAGDVPAAVRSLTAVSDSSFVVTAPGAIAGVTIDGDAARVGWSRRAGVLSDHHPVVGGTVLEVATRGGGAIELVDGRTGGTIEQLVIVPGSLQALEVAGDGYVALRPATLGTRLAGVGLDGTEQWSILGPEPVMVGDRVVVRATSSEATLRLAIYGEAA
jgi:hypothetical protein